MQVVHTWVNKIKMTWFKRFKKRINSLVYAETVNKYNNAFSDMEEFILCSGKTHLTKWLNWWDNRRNHVKAFQPVSAPSTNLAEASHASLKLSGGTGLNIVQSAIYDISECFKFEKSIEGDCLGYVKSGTGPSKALKTSRMEKRTLKNIDELMTELDGQYHSGEQGPSRVTIISFQPNESSSHRADKGKDPDK
ncbi:unnamed protein product [Mytilus coruscus]|uniref:Uncharacterized protein n=1 Tax=Mytilus coruscus TaxID=42192 RepID=A0A6J8E4Y5_MYTCO|nr:unnamed protein product [Mytilus coruscus]